MNKRRLAGIARWLERGAKPRKNVVGFDMSNGIRFKELGKATAKETLECGIICCIAGAACVFYNKPEEMIENFGVFKGIPWFNVRNEAQVLLDLSYDKAGDLFYGRFGPGVDPKWAARVIRKLIATGEVDWAGTKEP